MAISEHIGRISDLPVNNESNFVPNSEKRVVFGPEGRFWSDYVMRCFTFAPHAGIEKVHTHPWPHWMICLNGCGKAEIGGETAPMEAGMWMHVPGGLEHRFYNDSEEPLRFLCIVPPEGDVNPAKQNSRP